MRQLETRLSTKPVQLGYRVEERREKGEGRREKEEGRGLHHHRDRTVIARLCIQWNLSIKDTVYWTPL